MSTNTDKKAHMARRLTWRNCRHILKPTEEPEHKVYMDIFMIHFIGDKKNYKLIL